MDMETKKQLTDLLSRIYDARATQRDYCLAPSESLLVVQAISEVLGEDYRARNQSVG